MNSFEINKDSFDIEFPAIQKKLTHFFYDTSIDFKNDVFLERGKLYYSNTFVSQNNPTVGVVEDDNYQYYGFYHKPSYTTDASCTTLARGKAGGTFPDGISFIIPDIINKEPEIIDSSTVKLNLQIDSSGHTVDISGTNRLGFFLNHSTETWADASCNEKAYQDAIAGVPLDPPTISVATPVTVEEGALSSSHNIQNPHIFSNIVTFSSTTNRKIIINVSSWRVLITPDDPDNKPGNETWPGSGTLYDCLLYTSPSPRDS